MLHKVLQVLLIASLFPFCANGTVCQLDNTANPSGCTSYEGCEYIEANTMAGTPVSCSACQGSYFNNSLQNSTSCILCSDDFFTTTISDGKIWDSGDTSTGNTECPWKCTTGYYKTNDTCTLCPNGSTTTGPGAENVYDCNCSGTNSGIIEVSGGQYRCIVCPSGAHYDNSTHTCVCDITGATGITYNNNTASGCTCDSHASNQNGQCECDDGYATTVTDGVVYCTPCGTGEITQNGNCICDERHYGSHADGCTPCPSGTKVATLGTTTTKANCRAHSDTKFCNADGQNCMMLLQQPTD